MTKSEGSTTPTPDKLELTTSEVARQLDVAPDLLRKWKARGLLPSAPPGVSGQGRGVECHWSEAAIGEAMIVRDTRLRTRPKTRGAVAHD